MTAASKRVLVTGAAGFVGRHCLPLLVALGYEVHAVSRQPQAGQGVTWHQADLLQPGAPTALLAATRPSHLLHLAWCTAPGRYWQTPENLAWLRASLELTEAFAAHGGRRLVTSGTCAEYDWGDGVLAELTTPLSGDSLYAVCKTALCRTTGAYAAQVGLSWAWARLFFQYGPGEPAEKAVASVVRALLQGQPAKCSHGEQRRDFLYIGDVAAALVAILESPVTGPINVGSGKPTALKDLFQAIGRQLDHPELIQLGAIPAPAGDPPSLIADTTRLNREVGWQPSVGLEEGISATIAWWRAQPAEVPHGR